MKEVLEGQIELETALPYIDNCLGCQACQTACPSGVEYGDLITPFRAYAEPTPPARADRSRVQRALVLRTLPYPRRFRLAAQRSVGWHAPFRASRCPCVRGRCSTLLRRAFHPTRPLPAVFPARGRAPRPGGAARPAARSRCSIPTSTGRRCGCSPRNGVETVVPPRPGLLRRARDAHRRCRPGPSLARDATWHAFPDGRRRRLTNAAGCGSGMQEYPLLSPGSPTGRRAGTSPIASIDVSAFLD